MIRRLLVFVLVACLAVPTMAMPTMHNGPAPEMAADAHHHGHHMAGEPIQDHGQKAPAHAAKHECIGCVVPPLALAAPDKAVAPKSVPLDPAAVSSLEGRGIVPATPPPRA